MKAFLCILQFFYLINESDDLITIYSGQTKPAQKSFTSYSNTSGPAYENYSFTQKQEPNPVTDVRAKVHPSKLNGIEVFWKIVQEANNKEVMEKSRDFLNKLYTQLSAGMQENANTVQSAFIETYLNKIAKCMEDPMAFKKGTLNRMIKLMADMIDESEKKGTGGIKSHSAITKGEVIGLMVKNNLTSGKSIPAKMEVETYANTTIWELKEDLGKYIECSPECMKISIGSKDIKDTDHGKTIGEFLQKKTGVVTIDRKNMDDVPKAPLLKEDQTLTDRAKFAFAEIFDKFAKAGKMDAEGAAGFIRSTTGEKNVTSKDPRIKQLFKNFDKDKDGLLKVEEFQEFYRDCILNRKEDTVRNNLQAHGFRNDLKKINEIEPTPIDVKTLPRHMLSCNPKSFDLLFRALDLGGPAAEQVWDLVCRLTTNDVIYKRILSFDGPWEVIIDTRSSFRMLYCLQIIDSFLEAGNSEKKFAEWKQKFVETGGFAFLVRVLVNQDSGKGFCFGSGKTLGKFEKECLAVLQEVLAEFVKEAACTRNAEIKVAQAKYKKMAKSVKAAELEQVEEKPAETPSAQSPDREKSKDEQLNMEELFRLKPSTVLFPKNYHVEKEESPKGKDHLFAETHAKSIVDLVAEKAVWRKQLDILSELLLTKDSLDYYDTKLAKFSLALFNACVLSSPSIFPLSRSYSSNGYTFERLVIFGLLRARSQPVREEFVNVLYSQCYLLKDVPEAEQPLNYVLDLLIKSIPQNEQAECAEFFHILCKLIDMYYGTKESKKLFEPSELLASLATTLKTYKPLERRNEQASESLLVGIINTIRKLLDHEGSLKETVSLKEGLLGELFFNCLFPSKPLTTTQKCQAKESRAAAYKLLATLCRDSFLSQSSLVKDCLEPLCNSIKPHNGWGYIPSAESRSKLGYVGIENLGCICYMNSMLQQFYMVPSFRYELLAADDGMVDTKEDDDNVLHQLKRMFSFLELSERQYYVPKSFCFAFKDLDGNPTNTSLQQDAQEFLNLAFDRMENLMAGTPQKYLVRSIFGGKTCSQIICKGGCGSVRKNYEDFYNLSLGVKGLSTLSESLNKFIAGDTISDYFCENCQKKVDVVKRTSLYELPNVLIIHLQRIIYNFDTFMNEKINSRLEFPKEFSIEPYTLEGVEARENADIKEPVDHGKGQAYYRYKLAGVVVHIGTADAGHYYSYININRKRYKDDAEKDLFNPNKDVWLEFNDSRIRSFDIQKLESECFGGSIEQGWSIRTSENSMKNAYMLVYERELKTPVKKLLVKDEVAKLKENSTAILACENTAQPRAAVGQICFDSQKNEYYTFADFYDVQPKVPEGLSKVVQEDNANFLFERQIYSPEFFKFVNDIFSESCALLPSLKGEEKTQTEKSLANVGIKVIFDVLSHAYHNTSIKTLTKQFIGLLYESTSALGQLLAFIKDRFIAEVLLTFYKCPDKDARVAVKDLISNAILAAIKNEEAAKTAPEADKYEEAKKLLFYACRIIILMISNVNNDLAQNWGRFEQFFEVLLVVAKEGNDGMRKYMNSKDIVKILIDFYLEKESPFYVRGETRNPMGNRFRYPTFDALIDLVCILSSYADLSFIQPEDAKLRPLFDMPPSVYKLSEDSQTALMSSQFLIKTITHRHSTMPFARLIAFLSYDSKEYSKTVVKAVLKGISADLTQNLTSYFNVIKELLMINDSLQQLRLEWMLGIANMNKMFTQLAPNEKPYEQIKFGLSLINSVRDNVNEYPSPLAYKSLYDSLLNLLWTHRKNFEIQHISCILSLMVKSPAAFQYVTSLPPPTYQFAKYSDWFKPFVQNYRSTAKGTGILLTLFNLKRDDTGHQEALRLISELDQQWEKVVEKQGRYTERPDVLLRYPKPYIVGKATGENTVLQETIDGVTLMVSELVTECFESLPTGKDNLAIPEGYLENLVIDTESKEEKKTNMKPFSVEPMVLKFEVRNSNFKLHTMIGVTKPMKIRINITGKSPLNFYAPASTLSYIVEANRWAIIYMVQKQVPGKPWGEFAVQWSAKPTAVQGDIYRAEYDGIEGNYYQMEDIFPEETVGTARRCECCKGELTTGGMLCKKCAELFYSS